MLSPALNPKPLKLGIRNLEDHTTYTERLPALRFSMKLSTDSTSEPRSPAQPAQSFRRATHACIGSK